jgi:imidazolonepropionase-like amidohydrolase
MLRKIAVMLAGCGAGLVAGGAAAADAIAIKGGKIVPVVGPTIESGTIVVRDGKIVAIGKDVAIPAEARVYDASGKVVLPGFLEAHSPRGVEQSNERNPNVPFVSVVDSLDPAMEYFEECRRNGVTTIGAVPGDDTMIGGQAAVVKTAGSFIDQMIVKRKLGLKISLKPSPDRTRMSHLAALRRELDGVRDFLREEEEKKASTAGKEAKGDAKKEGEKGDAKKDGEKKEPEKKEPEKKEPEKKDAGKEAAKAPETPRAPEPNPQRDAIASLLKRELIAFIYCETAMDVPQAIKLIAEYRLRAILCLGQGCHKAAKLVAESRLPVVLDPTLAYWETDPRTGEDRHIVLPKIYREAGVPFTMQVTGFSGGNLFRAAALPPTVGTNYLWFQAATCVKYGLTKAEAIEAMTIRPAKFLGIDNLVGSLEVGKDADVAVLTGDPLELDTWTDLTFVGGSLVYERAKDAKLERLLKPAAAK